MIGVLDFGVGNIGSVLNMLKKLRIPSCRVDTPSAFEGVDKLILPGVGSFDHVVTKLLNSGLLPELQRSVEQHNVPILGICLGMHLLFERSSEGGLKGLGWLSGTVKRFDADLEVKVPHMGWNDVEHTNHLLLANIGSPPRFYFAHSYHVSCPDSLVLGTTTYGYRFASVIGQGHILGVQFHPEKSHKFGMKLLKNFEGLQ